MIRPHAIMVFIKAMKMILPTTYSYSIAILLLCGIVIDNSGAFTNHLQHVRVSSFLHMQQPPPKGCAAKPLEKKKVSVSPLKCNIDVNYVKYNPK